MKRTRTHLYLLLLLTSVFYTLPVYSQSSQYALYNYRNDGNFNAWLNLDIDSITYSCIDTLGVEHDDIVVQEVWTPDSLYRIPMEAIDSIGFRAPAPVMREGIFYLEEYHASHTLEIDSLTLYFDKTIDQNRLPSIGQVVLHNTFVTPYEEGFAGRVKSIEEVNGRIKMDCEMLCVGDVYKHLVLVGSAKTMTDEEASVASARTRGNGDPWVKYEDDGELPIRKIGDLTFKVFDGLISVVSKDPTLQVKYMVYVDEDIYHISANCQLTHNDLQYGFNLSLGKLIEIEDTIKTDKELKEITQALKRLQDFKDMSADEWVESFLNEKIQKGNKEKLSDDEAKVLGGLWDKLHGSWTIPIGGPFVLDLELGPLLKLKGDIELNFSAKTKARNTFYVEARGYTMATLANAKIALATGLAHIDGYSNFHSEPISSLSVSAKMKGSLSMGILGKASVSLIHKSIVHATVSGQGGLKLGGSIEGNWNSETNWEDYDWYEALKNTKIKAELFATFGVELGLTPWKFLTVGAEWEAYKNELGSLYLFPHFTKPELPTYLFDKQQWSNGNSNNHLILQSKPSKEIPDMLLSPCKLKLRIVDEEGNTIRESKEREYTDDNTLTWGLFPLEIDLSDLTPGKTYRCYPVLTYFRWWWLKATPSYTFTVPSPVSLKRTNLNIKKGDTKDIAISGGWGNYEIINDKSNIVLAYFDNAADISDPDDPEDSGGAGGGGGSSWSRLSDDFTPGGGAGGGGGSSWGSSWPNDETPTLHINGIDVGEATIQVKDMRSNETTSIKVVVTDEDITPLELSSTSLALSVGKDGSVEITSGTGNYTAESSDTDVATVEVSGSEIKVKALKSGTATITVTDTETTLTANIEVIVSDKESSDIPAEAIDLGLPSGTKWASYNVGATKPEEVGNYFAWGETIEKGIYSEDTYIYYEATNNKYQDLGEDITFSKYDVAQLKWGGNWRMPTKEEWQELFDNCDCVFDPANRNAGCRFTGPNGNSIILPFTRLKKDGEDEIVYPNDYLIYCWSSSAELNDNSKAFAFNFYNYTDNNISVLLGTQLDSFCRYSGMPVRPVCSYFIAPKAIDFGIVPKDSVKDERLVIKNVSTTIQTFHVSIDKSKYFEVIGESEFTLFSGEEKTLIVRCVGLPFKRNRDAIITIESEKDTKQVYLQGYGGDISYGEDAYAVLLRDDHTLTFYYDNNRNLWEESVYTYNLNNGDEEPEWELDYYTTVIFDPSFSNAKPTSTYKWFYDREMLSEIKGMEYLNTSNVSNMAYMFYGCKTLKEIETSRFNTQNVTNMEWMFSNCENLQKLNTSKFNTSNVMNMEGMFFGCKNLIELDVSNFNTSNVKDMGHMFRRCSNLKTIYCGDNWSLQSVSDSRRMFEDCTSLVGGKGTVYDENHIDGEYARIDGGSEMPGYFTDINAMQSDVPAEAVDLGLPSGTLWASYNVGAAKPEEYGGYYAWGETNEKSEYTRENYLYTGQDIGSNISGTEFDVAHVRWGDKWVMPSKEQFEELYKCCSSEWITVNGVNGEKITGTNGKSIFLPAGGYGSYEVYFEGDRGSYWTSTAPTERMPEDPHQYACYLRFENEETGNIGWSECPIGYSVRPVYVDGPFGKPSDGNDNGPSGDDDDGL